MWGGCLRCSVESDVGWLFELQRRASEVITWGGCLRCSIEPVVAV